MAVADADAKTGAGSIPAFEEEPVLGRYPVVAFSFNADASKLVLLYRDPATGDTVSQIPSEAALKQYEEAQRKERKESQSRLTVVVGGADGTPSAAAMGSAGHGARVEPGRAGVATNGGDTSIATTSSVGPGSTPVRSPLPGAPGGATSPVNLVI